MKTRLALILLVAMSLVFGSAWPSRSDEAGDEAADEQHAKIKELLAQAVNWYDVLPDTNAKAALHPQIVIRWRNAVRVHTGAALMAIWTLQGRPEAMVSIYQLQGGNICHELGSLSRSSKIVARDQTAVVWAPSKSGVDFRNVPDAPAPAENAAARFRQMKAIAERFTARLPERNGSNGENLRLLPKPLYRYELKESKDADPTLQDGGMFAFVMGTDPEVILLLEAVGRDDKVVWKYAFARATGTAADASLGNQVVWSESADTVGLGRTSTQFLIVRPIP
jgi:hypothetical protein